MGKELFQNAKTKRRSCQKNEINIAQTSEISLVFLLQKKPIVTLKMQQTRTETNRQRTFSKRKNQNAVLAKKRKNLSQTSDFSLVFLLQKNRTAEAVCSAMRLFFVGFLVSAFAKATVLSKTPCELEKRKISTPQTAEAIANKCVFARRALQYAQAKGLQGFFPTSTIRTGCRKSCGKTRFSPSIPRECPVQPLCRGLSPK